MIGIKIVGLETGKRARRIFGRRLFLHLVVAVFEDFQRQIIAGLFVVGFLDDLHPGCLFACHQRGCDFEREFAAADNLMQRPAALGAMAAENLEMDLRHARPLERPVCSVRFKPRLRLAMAGKIADRWVGAAQGAGRIRLHASRCGSGCRAHRRSAACPPCSAPKPRISLSTSSACKVPMTPAAAPRMPVSEQEGAVPGGGGSGNRQR